MKNVLFFSGDYDYELWLRYDLYTSKHTQWFYFSIQNTRPNVTYRFSIVNFMKVSSYTVFIIMSWIKLYLVDRKDTWSSHVSREINLKQEMVAKMSLLSINFSLKVIARYCHKGNFTLGSVSLQILRTLGKKYLRHLCRLWWSACWKHFIAWKKNIKH